MNAAPFTPPQRKQKGCAQPGFVLCVSLSCSLCQLRVLSMYVNLYASIVADRKHCRPKIKLTFWRLSFQIWKWMYLSFIAQLQSCCPVWGYIWHWKKRYGRLLSQYDNGCTSQSVLPHQKGTRWEVLPNKNIIYWSLSDMHIK